MNKKYLSIFLTAFLLIASSGGLFSQFPDLEINSLDYNGYPTVKIEFTALDSIGKQFKEGELNNGDVKIHENGVWKDGTVFCPNPGQSKFSTILVIDRSGSMLKSSDTYGKSRMDLAKQAAQTWIDNLPAGRFECAIMSFDNRVYLLQDFTEDKELLSNSLKSDSLDPAGGTDYNSAFMYDNERPRGEGALLVGERAKYPLYIVFLTDGEHNGPLGERSEIWVNEIVAKQKELGAVTYSVTMMPRDDIKVPSNEAGLIAISNEVYWNMTEEKALIQTFKNILSIVKTEAPPPPCIFEYETDCDGGGPCVLKVENSRVNVSESTTFTIPDAIKPSTVYDPPQSDDVMFLNIPPGQTSKKLIKLDAIKNTVQHYGKPDLSDDVNFGINNLLGYQEPGDTWEAFLEYLSPDSMCHPITITFRNSSCGIKEYTTSAGWIFARPIDFGTAPLKQTASMEYEAVFCNHTCGEINVTDFKLNGGDAGYFNIKKPYPTGTLEPGECVTLTFEFTPDRYGDFESNFEVTVAGYGTPFSSKITGFGSGAPILENIPDIDFAVHANCNTPSLDSIIKLNSIGALDLEITSIVLDQTGSEFSLSPNYDGQTIPSGESRDLTINFAPTKAGTYTVKVIITSNDDDNPVQEFNVTATLDSVYFETSTNDIDLGVFCPGEDGTETITLSVPGSTIDFGVDATVSGGLELTNLDASHWDMVTGGTQDLILTCNNTDEGDYTGVITFTDDVCNTTQVINVKWKVETAKISYTPITFEAQVGFSEPHTITVTNTSGRDLTITNVIFRDAVFSLGTSLDIVIPAGESKDIVINYAPTDDDNSTSYAILEGDPCGFLDSLTLLRDPTLALITLNIDRTYDGLIGQIIPVDLEINNANNFTNSGVTEINATINYDETLLEVVDVTKGSVIASNANGELVLTNIPVLAQEADQVIETIRFRVLYGSSATDCELDVADPSQVDGKVTFLDPNDGLFTLKPVTATIEIGTLSGNAGDMINLPITISNQANFDAGFHQNLYIDLRFHKMILECDDGSLTCSKDGDYRIATVKLPVSSLSADPVTVTKGFRAMLGTVPSTALEIDTVYFDAGYIAADPNNGEFTLVICDQGGPRLFDPNGTPGGIEISMAPNPTLGTATIEYKMAAPGKVEIYISDILGTTVKQLLSKEAPAGEHSFEFDASGLNSGNYIIHMRTSTESASKRFNVIR